MAKFLELDMEDTEEICNVGKALSSPIRIDILRLLYEKSLIIGEIAKELKIPASSAAMHVKILESAQLIRLEEQPGTRGGMKLCHRKSDFVNISLLSKDKSVNEIASLEMPIGAFTACKVVPTCGIASRNGIIGMEDTERSFYLPEKIDAQVLWSSGGYIEYRFANIVPHNNIPKRMRLTLEICSEAPNYRENWKSDIMLWINGVVCGEWCSPGDFGARRGRLNPPDWPDGATQYGNLVSWEITTEGVFINNERLLDTKISELRIMDQEYIEVRIGNREDARYVGGFNVFGKGFGDYEQDIILSVEY